MTTSNARKELLEKYQLDPSEMEELTNIVENGPLDAGRCIGSRTKGSLMKKGLVIAFSSLKDDWCNIVATYEGGRVYMALYGSAVDDHDYADTIKEAHQNRLAKEAIKLAMKL